MLIFQSVWRDEKQFRRTQPRRLLWDVKWEKMRGDQASGRKSPHERLKVEQCSKPRLVVWYKGWNSTHLYMEIIMGQYKDPYKPIRIQWFRTVAGKASRWPNALQLLELRGADAFAISAGIGDEPRKCLWVAGRKKGQGAKCQWNYHERENTGWNLEWFQ